MMKARLKPFLVIWIERSIMSREPESSIFAGSGNGGRGYGIEGIDQAGVGDGRLVRQFFLQSAVLAMFYGYVEKKPRA